MRRKTLLTPVFRLDCPTRCEFIEILVEPRHSGQPQPWFQHLQGLGLERAIQLARRALVDLEGLERVVDVYWTNPLTPLSHTEGVALALALSVWVLDDRCPYHEVIVIGRLKPRGTMAGRGATIEDTGYRMPGLTAVAALGFRSKSSCLILSPDPLILPDRQALLAQIERLGIDVYQVGTLDAAVAACLSARSGKVRWT